MPLKTFPKLNKKKPAHKLLRESVDICKPVKEKRETDEQEEVGQKFFYSKYSLCIVVRLVRVKAQNLSVGGLFFIHGSILWIG